MPHPLALHRSRLDTASSAEQRHTHLSRRLSRARLAVAGAGLLLVILAAGYGLVPAALAWTLGALGGVGFVLLVVWHDRVERQRRLAAAHAQLSREALARFERRWDDLPLSARVDEGAWATADDLDLFGRASLRHLLGRTATPGGERRLQAWIHAATAGAPDDLQARQEAVRELAPLLAHREAQAAARLVSTDLRAGSEQAVRAWVETGGSSWLAHPLVAVAALAVPLAAALLVWVEWTGGRAGGWWVLLAGVAWAARAILRRPIERAFAGSDALTGEARRYAEMLERWERLPAEAPFLVSRQARLGHGTAAASRAMRSLVRLVDLADLRYSHLPHVLVHSVTAWDIHVACALERWRMRHGAQVGEWFEALADLDALATLASVAHDEPDWTLPTVEPGVAHAQLTARALAHPLLTASARIANDVAIGPPGTVLVITGSNMSGKSTLLRAIGLNIVLAQLGAPVCAGAMTSPSLHLETSIRITDSLAAGVSYFMAALLRLKEVVTAADAQTPGGDAPRVLYLLDEVLQGTNSEDRQVAIRHIVGHLAASSAIGALTTHDLHLVHTPEFQRHAQLVHFTEHVSDGPDGVSIDFDYRLRPGPAQSRNALALLRMVGLGDARPLRES